MKSVTAIQETAKTFISEEGPGEGDEHQKIDEFFQSLDDLIAVEAQKIETLKALKKGMMQRLYPRQGETAPRLRFPQFRNRPWANRSSQVPPKANWGFSVSH